MGYEYLDAFQHMRKRPLMYISTVDTPIHLLWEVLDNAADEALNGYAKEIRVEVEEGRYSVYDNGRGMHTNYNPDLDLPDCLGVFVVPFSGGKFSGDEYSFRSGTHGVGLTVVAALSTKVEVQTARDSRIVTGVIENGEVKECKVEEWDGDTFTKVTFYPDPEIFSSVRIRESEVTKRLKIISLMTEAACFLNGESVTVEAKEFAPGEFEPLNVEYVQEDFRLLMLINWQADINKTIITGGVNSLPVELGSHITAARAILRQAMRKAFPEAADYPDEILLVGISAWVGVWIESPEYRGQTKYSLGTPHSQIFGKVPSEFIARLANEISKNPSVVRLVRTLQEEKRRVVESTRADKLLAKSIRFGSVRAGKVSRDQAPSSLYECSSPNREETALIICEGESAAGGVVKVRDRKLHAVYPLRGKIANAADLSLERLLKSQVLKDLVNAIGIGVWPKENLDACRYGRIVILCDADPDGKSIAALVLGLFSSHMPSLLTSGKVYYCQAPLYKYKRSPSGQCPYVWNSEELDKGRAFIRFKGIGEMSPKDLAECLFGPWARLVRITSDMSDIEGVKSFMRNPKSHLVSVGRYGRQS